MFSTWQWIIILVIVGILGAVFDDRIKDYNCYDKSPYKCGKCRKNCKWKYIVKKFEELEKESEN